MNAFFDEIGRLLYNSHGFPLSITSIESQINLFYVIKRKVFNQIVIWKIGSERSSGRVRDGMVEDYIKNLRPHEDISSLFMKDSKSILCGSREQVNEVIRSTERAYSRYKSKQSADEIPKEELFYMLFSPEEAKLEYSKENRWSGEATLTSHPMDGIFITSAKPKTIDGKIVIGTIHSHPDEVRYWDISGNDAIFKSQFSKSYKKNEIPDGVNAKKWRIPKGALELTKLAVLLNWYIRN
jgi:hypothetical protein